MATLPVYTSAGKKSDKTVKLSDALNVKLGSFDALKQAYNAQLAALRNAHPSTKLRGEVRGGGRKPWRQKGTGRARAGSIRSPLWRGGGITFGPTGQENHKLYVPKKMRQHAFRQALRIKHDASQLFVIESVKVDGKTKSAAAILDTMELSGKRTVMVVDEASDNTLRSFRNIPRITVTTAARLNVRDVVDASAVVFEQAAYEATEKRLRGDK